jgi:predicted nucleic acid-binding protein
MPVGIDTSVLIAAEKLGSIEHLLPEGEDRYYISSLAATEFLVGIHPPVRNDLRQRAQQLYEKEFRFIVSPYTRRMERSWQPSLLS